MSDSNVPDGELYETSEFVSDGCGTTPWEEVCDDCMDDCKSFPTITTK